MKRIIIMAAIVSFTFVGCVQKEDSKFPDGRQQEIIFSSPVVKPNTRAHVSGEMAIPYSTLEQFNVYAVWHLNAFSAWSASTPYMNKVTCVYNGSSGTSSKGKTFEPAVPYYWPKTGKLTFAAYSPADVTPEPAYGAAGLTITDFSVNANGISKTGKGTVADEQFDLMFTDRVKDQTKVNNGSGAHYDGINLVFKHAMSSVLFTVNLDKAYSDWEIKLKNITLSGITSNGTFTENNTDGGTAGTPAWAAASVPATSSFTAYNNDPGESVTYNSVGGTKLIDFGSAGAGREFIMIPQAFSTATPKISITWSLKSPTGQPIDQTVTKDLQDLQFTAGGESAAWKIGYRYTYNITIALDRIYFNPTVDVWSDAAGGDITL